MIARIALVLSLVPSLAMATNWDSQSMVNSTLMGTPHCSTSNSTGVLYGRVHVKGCAAMPCVSPTYVLTPALCTGGPKWSNADIHLIGWQWNKESGIPDTVRQIHVGVTKSSLLNGQLRWTAEAGMSERVGVIGEQDFTIDFEIILSAQNSSEIVSTTWSCSQPGSQCTATNVLNGAIHSGWNFGGFSISKFDVEETDSSGAGLAVAQFFAGIQPYTVDPVTGNLTASVQCALKGSTLGPGATQTCSVTANGLQGVPTEIEDSLVVLPVSHPMPIATELATREGTSTGTFARSMACGLRVFALNATDGPWNLWSAWAGTQYLDCGASQAGSAWSGIWQSNLGSIAPAMYPNSGAGTGVWPTNSYSYAAQVTATKLK